MIAVTDTVAVAGVAILIIVVYVMPIVAVAILTGSYLIIQLKNTNAKIFHCIRSILSFWILKLS